MGSEKTILVIGGGISGITAAIEAAEVGYDVILIEQNPVSRRQGQAKHSILPQTLCPGLRIGD